MHMTRYRTRRKSVTTMIASLSTHTILLTLDPVMESGRAGTQKERTDKTKSKPTKESIYWLAGVEWYVPRRKMKSRREFSREAINVLVEIGKNQNQSTRKASLLVRSKGAKILSLNGRSANTHRAPTLPTSDMINVGIPAVRDLSS